MAPLARVQFVEVRGEVDHPAQRLGRFEPLAGVDQLARPRDGWEQVAVRYRGTAARREHPGTVGAGHLTAVDAADLAQLDVALGHRGSRADQRRPARGPFESRAGHRTPGVERLQVGRVLDHAHPQGVRPRPDLEAGHGRRGRRVAEGQRRGIDDVDRAPAEAVEQQMPDRLAVVHVEPLGAGDEAADVAGPPVQGGREEEVGVQSRQAREARPEAPGREARPGLRIGGEVVVPHVGRIADEGRAPVVPGNRRLRVVGVDDAHARHAAQRREARAREQCREGVGVDCDDLRIAAPRDLQREASAAAARVDDARRRLLERPAHHRAGDRGRREHLAELSPLGLRARSDQPIAEWILPRADRVGGIVHITIWRGGPRRGLADEASFAGRQRAAVPGRAERDGQRGQRELRAGPPGILFRHASSLLRSALLTCIA